MTVFNNNSQSNFVNSNEVFPILDIISRERQRLRHSGEFDPNGENSFDRSPSTTNERANWKVESFYVDRDPDNPTNPNVIKTVRIVYVNGAEELITLVRGANPPVPSDAPDSDYINNLLLTEVFIELIFDGYVEHTTARIIRENGYGQIQGVEIDYHEDHDHDHEEDDFFEEGEE